LSIVKKLIDLMSGSLWFESEEGKGSTFYFSIPLTIQGKKNNELLFTFR
jgi:signal transduction histidine kinase